MPAEIDKGGPRVLHCVERADCRCPITRAPPIAADSRRLNVATAAAAPPAAARRSGASGSTTRRRRRDAVHRQRRRRCDDRSEDDDDDDDEDDSSAEPGIIPGSDERDEFFRDDGAAAVVAAAAAAAALQHPTAASSNDLAALRARRGRKRSEAARRRSTIQRGIGKSNEDDAEEVAACRCDLDEAGRTVDEVERLVPVDDTRQQQQQQRLSAPASTDSSSSSSSSIDGSESSESARVIRLFERRCGCGCVDKDDGARGERPIFGRRDESAAISSQRGRPPDVDDDDDAAQRTRQLCDVCSWQCDSFECARKSARRSSARRTQQQQQQQQQQQHKRRSYVQLALLLLLVAIGHSGLVRSNNVAGRHHGATTGVGASLAAIGGALVGAARAAPVDLDAGVRAERSANLSHITGVSRKIQMYIKNRHLQILPDGSVNGSNDDTSEYTIFQRTSVSRGQLRIQGVATCLYLCMDSCGLLYGSREYTDDCVFNETLEQHNYNSYSSVRWSTAKKTLYLGLNRWGQPRRVQARGHNLGRLSAYARVLTQVAPPDRVEALQARMLGAQHGVRHRHGSHHRRNVQQIVCPTPPPQEKDGRDKFRCRKRKKRKKRKRRCRGGEKPGPQCEIPEEQQHHQRGGGGSNAEATSVEGQPQSKRSCEGAASEELCRKQALDAPAKKRKSRIEGDKDKKQQEKQHDKKQQHQQQDKQQRNRGKDVRPKKTTAEGARSPKGEDSGQRSNGPNGPNGGRRKRPPGGKQQQQQQQQRPGPNRKKVAGRVTRTSVAVTSPTPPAITLPSTWYPFASTTPTMEPPLEAGEPWSTRRRTKEASPRNAVTSGELKSEEVVASGRSGKALEVIGILDSSISSSSISSSSSSTSSSFVTETSVEMTLEDLSTSASSSFVDSSVENVSSEDTRSDESGVVEDEDTTTAAFAEISSTPMTTMDTTPPERTEDYTRATTPSMLMLASGSEKRRGSIDDFKDTVRSRTGVGRLAM